MSKLTCLPCHNNNNGNNFISIHYSEPHLPKQSEGEVEREKAIQIHTTVNSRYKHTQYKHIFIMSIHASVPGPFLTHTTSPVISTSTGMLITGVKCTQVCTENSCCCNAYAGEKGRIKGGEGQGVDPAEWRAEGRTRR